jgi:hypothetical protein
MPNLPDDIGQKSKSNMEASSSSESNRPAEPTEKCETVHDQIMKEISKNPKWSEAPNSGTGFVLVGRFNQIERI